MTFAFPFFPEPFVYAHHDIPNWMHFLTKAGPYDHKAITRLISDEHFDKTYQTVLK